MDIAPFQQIAEYAWRYGPEGAMRVPAVFYADRALLAAMDDKVLDQVRNVAMLPGIVTAAYAMPDAHSGYGFPIGGVAAFDADAGGVVSAGGVGFDVSCGVRTLLTGLRYEEVAPRLDQLADLLFFRIPAGLGRTGHVNLSFSEIDDMLLGGARWAVERGFGVPEDLLRMEEQGCMPGAMPGKVSEHAKRRQKQETGTLGSGNHYGELQRVEEIYDQAAAARFGLRQDDVVFTIHCGSRGLGHQVGTDYGKRMRAAAAAFGIVLPDRELACAPIHSELGQAYLGAMRSAINCALANRQVITALVRKAMTEMFPGIRLDLLYDVSHNTCKVEEHEVDGVTRTLHVHRKGATRALAPGHPALADFFRETGQPVLIGGSMGSASYVLAGVPGNAQQAFGSACHGAGRAMSRHEATRRWRGRAVMDALRAQGVIVKTLSVREIAEEAPGAYKDVAQVIDVTARAGLARRVARLSPLISVKG